ncbi:hypothetical protein HZS_6140 [Henneguya salminicola]|nr:hypothetical protein HZS_6140 [Henneguya salminicola]
MSLQLFDRSSSNEFPVNVLSAIVFIKVVNGNSAAIQSPECCWSSTFRKNSLIFGMMLYVKKLIAVSHVCCIIPSIPSDFCKSTTF